MAKNDTMRVEVRAASFETRSGIKAKRGDVIEVPADSADQSNLIRHGLRSGNLKRVGTPAMMDTSAAPAITQEDLDKLREENEELKKERTVLKGQVTKLKNAQANAEDSEEEEKPGE